MTRQSDAILERLMQLHPKVIDLSLDRVLRLLDRLGRPQDRLPPVVHVAGTNGKGSVIAFLRAMLEAAGLRVHAYTSPHLVRFHERIRLAGSLIGEPELASLLAYCEQINGGEPITYFEITTAAAFHAFAETPADILLLEVGLGGRADATNVIDRPALTVITPVSMDHMDFLGADLPAIAGEKAAIQKPGVVSVIGPQRPEAAAAIAEHAERIGAPLFRDGIEWAIGRAGQAMRYQSAEITLGLPLPALAGSHQVANAGTAVACLEMLSGIEVPEEAIRHGLASVSWPARLQRLTRGPLPESLPRGWELWLDGGHNAGAGAALARTVAGWRANLSGPRMPLHLVFGILSTKQPVEFLRPLAPHAASLKAVAIPGAEASLSAAEAAQAARSAGIPAEPVTDVAAALAAIRATVSGPARVLICGSLYLAGSVLAENG